MAVAPSQATPSLRDSKPIAVNTMKIDPPMVAPPRVDSVKAYKPNLDVMSPVNQNGSFEFDRVLKSGTVVKRTRKTKQWKPVYIVLRSNLLSIYRDKDETKLRHQISLSDLTAVARQRDSKKKMAHVFAIFSPARNYHFAAPTDKDAQAWVDLIRAEARIDEGEDDVVLVSPKNRSSTAALHHTAPRENVVSSSSEAEPRPSSSIAPENMHSARRPSHALNSSANEYGSLSDFSDNGGPAFHASMVSLPHNTQPQPTNTTTQNNIGDDRVISHGWLWVLKSKGGVRQWKKVWVVLRPKALGIYKNGQEYSASLIIPFESIIDAVDIDAASKSKQHCMQVISEEKNLRFCAADEESLAKWLGAFKSLLIKRKEAEHQRTLQAANSGNTQPPKPATTTNTNRAAK